MKYETIALKKQNHIAILTLNRPEKLNAVSHQMTIDLLSAIEDVAKDDEVRVLVLTGAGRGFCSGADFRFSDVRSGAFTPETAEDQRPTLEARKQGHLIGTTRAGILALHRLEKPTIAVVNGDAVGLGFDYALVCDMRVGSPNARFMVGYTRRGVNPDNGTTWLLTRVIGVGRALEYILTGDFCGAEEAYRIGILNKLVSAAELEKEAMSLATRLANGPPVAQRLARLLVYKNLEVDLETALTMESACISICLGTEDNKEGIQAFAEKRQPIFKGK